MIVHCHICYEKIDTEVEDYCKECKEPVWFSNRENLLMLHRRFPDIDLDKLLSNPEDYQQKWEDFLNERSV